MQSLCDVLEKTLLQFGRGGGNGGAENTKPEESGSSEKND